MKGFLKWFSNSSKMKRWILVILIGIILASYGMVNLLIGKELNFDRTTPYYHLKKYLKSHNKEDIKK